MCRVVDTPFGAEYGCADCFDEHWCDQHEDFDDCGQCDHECEPAAAPMEEDPNG